MHGFWFENKNSLCKNFKRKEMRPKRAEGFFITEKDMHLNPTSCWGKMFKLYGHAGGPLKTYSTNAKVMQL